MFKKLMLLPLLSLLVFLAGCGPTVYADDGSYANQANIDSQRTYQQQYGTYAMCYSAFPFAGDCYRGVNGMWYSPFYYPWGAVIHRNNTITYGRVVPIGGVWVHNTYPVHVDFSYSRSYVNSRTSYYRSQSTSYRNSSSSYRSSPSTSYSNRSTPSTTSYSNRTTTSPVTTSRTTPNFGSRTSYTPPTRSSTPSRSSYTPSRSSGSSYRSSGSSSSSRSSGRR